MNERSFDSATTGDLERKRQQLLEGALAEFAEHCIATRAGVSAGPVYSFCENKEGLFEAVYDSIAEQTVSSLPIDAGNLPEYAGGLYDAGLEHPEVMRLVAWYALEGERRPAQEVFHGAGRGAGAFALVGQRAEQAGRDLLG